MSEKETKNKKVWPFLIAVIVAAVALAAGIGIYNTPANRLQRQLDLGNKFLEEQQYEQAVLAFEQAIAIDEHCMEAYAGGVKAYLASGDADGAENFYERTITMLSGLDELLLAENMDAVVELYLAAEQVYVEDQDRIAQVLEESLKVTGEDARIKDKQIETYLGIAKEKTEGATYEEALKIYDRLLELDRESETVIDDLCDCLNRYIDQLVKVGNYDKIRELAEKYMDSAVKVDFAGILAMIAEKEEADTLPATEKVLNIDLLGDPKSHVSEIDFRTAPDAEWIVVTPTSNTPTVPMSDRDLDLFYIGTLENYSVPDNYLEIRVKAVLQNGEMDETDYTWIEGGGRLANIPSGSNCRILFDHIAGGIFIEYYSDGVMIDSNYR